MSNPANLLMVERERELAVLMQAVQDARNGLPSVVLLVGEPGLGKSHLLRSLREVGDVIRLNGYSLEADAPPYFPFTRAMARLGRDGSAAGPRTPLEVLRGARIISGRDETPGAPIADGLAVADALTEVLIDVAIEAPVILILDDMQWASGAAWEAVTYLARAAEGARLVVVLASRPEAIEPPGAGAEAVTELNRNGFLRLVHLRPLSSAGISTIVERSLGAGPSPALLNALVARTGGNPFFLEEVLRSLTEAGEMTRTAAGFELGVGRTVIPVPETLRLAIWQRVSRLPDSTVDVLQAGAIIGRVFEASLLSEMLGQPADWIGGRLGPAIRAGVITEEAPGRWSFAHDTLREAITDQIGERRADLHRRAAAALGKREGADAELQTAATIARHLGMGGDLAAAVIASLRASGLALAGRAAEQALELAGMAETFFDSASVRPAHISRRDVQTAVGRAAAASADYARAEAAWSAVLEVTADRPEQARVLVELGTVARRAERSDAAASYFERALVLLEHGNDSRTLTEALIELATLEGTTRSDYSAAIERGETALRLARDAGDAGLEARAALALANAQARGETPVAARPLLLHSLERSLEVNELAVAAEAAASLSNAFYWTGELQDAIKYAEQRLEIAQSGRDAFALRHAYTWLALLATTAGKWDRAHEMVSLAEPAIARLGSPEPLGFLRLVEGLLALRTGEVDLALTRSREAMDIFLPLGDATVSWYVAVHIWALIAAGKTTEAAAECLAQEGRLATMPESALPARSSRCGLGRAYAALGDRASGLACEEKLAPYADDFHWRPARLTLAALASLRGDGQASIQLLRTVVEKAERDGLTFDAMDARRIMAALESGASTEEAFARPDAPPIARSVKPVPGGLSAREQEVLQLVAKGLSNRDIGMRLVISERTVVNHVSHIFEKIGVDNRASATAFAFRTGLVGAE